MIWERQPSLFRHHHTPDRRQPPAQVARCPSFHPQPWCRLRKQHSEQMQSMLFLLSVMLGICVFHLVMGIQWVYTGIYSGIYNQQHDMGWFKAQGTAKTGKNCFEAPFQGGSCRLSLCTSSEVLTCFNLDISAPMAQKS